MNLTDPTGHFACGDGIDDPRCDQYENRLGYNKQNSTGVTTTEPAPAINYSDEYGLCVFGNCSGGAEYRRWWQKEYLPILDQDIDNFLDFTDETLLPVIDGIQGYTGIDVVNQKVGFGLDFAIQVAKDRNKDLNPRQRLGRALIVGSQGAYVSYQGVSAANIASVAVVGPATSVAVRTGNLHAATVMIGGTWIGTYAGVNWLLGGLYNVGNSYLFPRIGLGTYP